MDNRSLINRSAADLARLLPTLVNGVRLFSFVVYEPRLSLAERLVDVEQTSADMLERARRIQELTGGALSLRDAILMAAWTSSQFDVWVREAIRHDGENAREDRLTVSAADLSAGWLKEKIAGLENEQAVALDSRCVLDNGDIAHLPLMDFRVLRDADGDDNIALAVRAIGQKRGAVVQSGNSYHYYGFQVLSSDQWAAFMARCLLLSPLTDVRYIGHRLLAGGAALRLTSSRLKPARPSVVRVL